MKSTFATLTEIPEALRSEYTEQGGKFVLKVEGDHPLFVPLATHEEMKTKVSTFRDNNIGLNTKVTELEGKLKVFGDLTPDAVTEMKTRLEGFEKKGAKTPDDLDAKIKAEVEPLRKKLEAADLRDAENAKQRKISERRTTLLEVAAKIGIREEAIPDFISRGSSVFGEDGVPRVDGKEVFSKVDPSQHITPQEYAEGLRTTAGHLFKPSTGGGANPNPSNAPKLTIPPDPKLIGQHMEAIARGEVIVAMPNQ